jgi:hypothetical protein
MGMRPAWNGALAPEAGITMRIQVIQKHKRPETTADRLSDGEDQGAPGADASGNAVVRGSLRCCYLAGLMPFKFLGRAAIR